MNSEQLDAFRAELELAGLRPKEIVADGEIHRCPVEGKAGGKDGAYAFFPNNPPSGWFQNWRSGQKQKWSSTGWASLGKEERQRLDARIQESQERRKAKEAKKWAEAAERAKKLFTQAQPCVEHPYLREKGVKYCPNLKVDDSGRLLVSVLGPSGEIQSLQFIDPDGEKLFMAGGKVKGGYFPVEGVASTPILVCEGLATGLSLYEATGAPVFVAFNAGNLERVACCIREQHPNRPIVICGDNDHQTDGNPGMTKALAAASAVKGKLALPKFKDPDGKTDFNDLHQAEGLNMVKAWVEAGEESAVLAASMTNWSDPIPFEDHQVSPLPAETLPEWGRDFVMAVAEHLQVDQSLVYANVLGAVATGMGGRYSIEIKNGYEEPLNLFILATAPPAERKTATQGKTFLPLYKWEREQARKMKKEIEEASSKRKSEEAIIKSLRSQLRKAQPEKHEELIKEIAELESNLTRVPTPPCLLADDITPEAAAVVMEDNGERLGIASCEGGLFETIAGRYNSGVPNMDLFLKAHACEPVSIHRKQGPPIKMAKPTLTMCLCIQPDVLLGLVDKPGFRGRGLLARFAYILPQSKLGRRLVDAPPIPTAIQEAYSEALTMILNLSKQNDQSVEPNSDSLWLEKPAYAVWKDFAESIETELGEGGQFETLRDWAGKLPGLAARLAGNLHVMEHLEQAPTRGVSEDTMERALDLTSALVGHAMAAFGMMGADPEIEAAKHILAWIQREGIERFSARDCHWGLRSRFPKVDRVKTALAVLEEREYVMAEAPPEKKKAGRPSSPTYVTNPKIWKRD